MNITRDELIKLAQISYIGLSEDEIPLILEKITAVLNYAEQVTEFAQTAAPQQEVHKNVNIFRTDESGICDPDAILTRAPEVQGHYFVVPRILKQ